MYTQVKPLNASKIIPKKYVEIFNQEFIERIADGETIQLLIDGSLESFSPIKKRFCFYEDYSVKSLKKKVAFADSERYIAYCDIIFSED